MNQVKTGIIGLGSMGNAHLNSIGQLNNGVVTAVCDIDPERLVPLRGRKDIRTFTDPDRFFAEADMEAVLVATPHYDHPPLGIRALRSGRHLLVEKPVGVHKNAVEPLLAEAAAHPELKTAVMFNQRTIPAHRKIKQLIENGELGRITRINWIISDWFRTQTYYNSGGWRATWAGEGGGVLLNQCPHQLDLMQWFFGMPKRILAMGAIGKYHDIEVEDELTALLEYPDGATGVFVASTGEAPGTNRLEITCDRGKLVYEGGVIRFFRNEVPVSKFSAETELRFGTPDCWDVTIPAAGVNPVQHRDILENFFKVIRQGGEPVAPLAEGLRSLELGNAMLMAALKKREVVLPLDGDEFEAMLRELIAGSTCRKKTFGGKLNADEFGSSF